MVLTTIAEEIERYLRTGDADMMGEPWPGDILERGRRQHADLRGALVDEVRRLAKGRTHEPLPDNVGVEFTRGKMSWIDRINAAIVRRIHGKATLSADEPAVELHGQRLAYADLRRAVAYRHPNLVGDDLTMALDFDDGRVVVVSENDEAWTTILSALDRHPRNQRPSTVWRLALVAAGADERIELLG